MGAARKSLVLLFALGLSAHAGAIACQYLMHPPAQLTRGLPFCLFDGQLKHTSRCVFWQGPAAQAGGGIILSFDEETAVQAIHVFTCDPNQLPWAQSRTQLSAWNETEQRWRELAILPDTTGTATDAAAVHPLIKTSWQGQPVRTQFLRIQLPGAGIWLSELQVETANGVAHLAAPEGEQDRAPTVIPLRVGQDIACGSSRHASVWNAPKPDNNRFYIGHGNQFAHSYRTLTRVDITPFLLPARIDKAQLVVQLAAVFGARESRVLAIEHLTRETRVLAWADLRTGRAEEVCRIVVDRAKPPLGECYIDVSKAVNADLAKGYAYSAFRIRDVFAEADGNPDNKPSGAIAAPQGMRLLVWETAPGR